MAYPLRATLAARSLSTEATSDCCAACSSTHSRTTFCSARIWRTSWSTPLASSLTASSAGGAAAALDARHRAEALAEIGDGAMHVV